MVIGGQALLLYGEPRLTKDIDITLGIGLEGLATIMALVSELEFKPLVSDPEAFVKETMVFPVAEEKSGIRIDFIFSYSSYEKQAIERANEIKLGDTMVRFASLEDIIIYKILAGRPRDIEDVESILLKNPGYDTPYINKWLFEFSTALGRDYVAEFQAIINKLK